MSTNPCPASIIYPRFLFHHSPFFQEWVKLSIYDIINVLQVNAAYEGQNVFFYGNYPVEWITVVGRVLLYEDGEKRFKITLDDGSGNVLDVIVDKSSKVWHEAPLLRNIEKQLVVKAKGSLGLYKGQRQLQLKRIVPIENTDAEVKAWKEVIEFRCKHLSKPWKVSQATLLQQWTKFNDLENSDGHQPPKDLEAQAHDSAAVQRKRPICNDLQTNATCKRQKPVPAEDSRASSDHSQDWLRTADYEISPQGLKRLIWAYCCANAMENISLSRLRTINVIELFSAEVAEKFPIQPLHSTSKPLSRSTQIFQTLLNALTKLAQDGNILHIPSSTYRYIVVGRWNVQDLINDACKVFPITQSKAVTKKVQHKSTKVSSRDIWKRAQGRGGAWSGATKSVISDVVKEILMEKEGWVEETRGIWVASNV